MRSLFQAVQDLHSAELYDDLKFLVSLQLEEHLLDELDEIQQALLFKMIGDSYFHTDCFFQSIKLYERALEIVRRLSRNSYPKSIFPSEIRFLIHKALVRQNKHDDAIKVLSQIPKSQQTAKTMAALSKLLSSRKPNSKSEIINCNNFVLSQFPLALYTYNEMFDLGSVARKNLHELEDDCQATRAYFKSRALVADSKPLQAISALKTCTRPNAKISLELANLYNFVGNRSKAISELERLRLLNPYGVKGMDLLASLYYANQLTNSSSRELETLVGYLTDCHPNEPETLIALGYLSKYQNHLKDASLFAQRAMSIASSGKDKSHAALLRALTLFEAKNYSAADQFLNNVILIDSQNIDAYDMKLRSYLHRNPSCIKEAKAIGSACLKNIGRENPRANLIYAQSIYSDPHMKGEFERQIKSLVDEAPFLTDAIVLLANYYNREMKNFDEALVILKKAAESNLSSVVQTVIKDIESKCKNTPNPTNSHQSFILNQNDAMDSLILNSVNSTPIATTPPDCDTSIVYNRNVYGAPRRQRSNAIRQSGIDLMQRLEFSDSFELDLRQDLFSNGFRTPTNAFTDDEDIDVVNNVTFLRRS